MRDPDDGILETVVFQHETRVKNAGDNRFESRGILVADFMYHSSEDATSHFDNFNEHPTFLHMVDPTNMPSIPANTLDAAIMINKVIKLMTLFKDSIMFEERKHNQDELIRMYLESLSDFNDD